ncbi:MAG: GtrA family protein [Candidatus Magasanikbacteria bacterium]|nr:GtrA family protein [Candidatus Magasanikbacteria bacterium]
MQIEIIKIKIKHSLNFLWGLRLEFFRYFVVGITALLLDLSLLILIKDFLNLDSVRAVMLGQIPVFFYVFFLNKYWSFGSKKMVLIRLQFIKYLIVVGFNYIIGIATMIIFNHFLEFDAKLVRIGTIALGVSWNFFLYRYWIYS